MAWDREITQVVGMKYRQSAGVIIVISAFFMISFSLSFLHFVVHVCCCSMSILLFLVCRIYLASRSRDTFVERAL